MSLLVGWLFLLVSNLIHNGGGLDPAVLPSAVLGAIHLWRGGRGWLIASALFIAAPSFLFLDGSALMDADEPRRLANHWALFLGGTAALVSIGTAIWRRR